MVEPGPGRAEPASAVRMDVTMPAAALWLPPGSGKHFRNSKAIVPRPQVTGLQPALHRDRIAHGDLFKSLVYNGPHGNISIASGWRGGNAIEAWLFST